MGKTLNLPDVRVMTRRQVKELRKAGLDPALMSKEDAATIAARSADMIEWILDNVYSDFNFDDISYSDCWALATETYRRTMGLDSEIKNS